MRQTRCADSAQLPSEMSLFPQLHAIINDLKALVDKHTRLPFRLELRDVFCCRRRQRSKGALGVFGRLLGVFGRLLGVGRVHLVREACDVNCTSFRRGRSSTPAVLFGGAGPRFVGLFVCSLVRLSTPLASANKCHLLPVLLTRTINRNRCPFSLCSTNSLPNLLFVRNS